MGALLAIFDKSQLFLHITPRYCHIVAPAMCIRNNCGFA